MNTRLLNRAKKMTQRREEDNSFQEAELVENLARIIPGADQDTIRLAREIVDWHTIEGNTKSDGLIAFPGKTPYAYEPHRLIRNGRGQIIELANATLEFMEAEANDAHKKLHEAQRRLQAATEALRLAQFGYSGN